LTSGGCQTIIASGYLVTFYVKPGVKKHKNRIRQLADPIHLFLKNIVSIFSFLFDLSEVVFVLSFTRPFHVKRDTAGRAIIV
jgi:hypothetical protein